MTQSEGDSIEAFKGDTVRSGGGKSNEDLIDVLVVWTTEHIFNCGHEPVRYWLKHILPYLRNTHDCTGQALCGH